MKKTCFVIMPFSETNAEHTEEYWDKFFANVKDIMNSLGYECERSEVGPYKLFNNIARKIDSSDIVVAVLTDFNPNVWYELGMRHTLRDGTIMLLPEGRASPFDIKDFGIIFYEENINFHKDLKEKIEDYISKLSPDESDSPILTALSTKRLKIAEQKNKEYEGVLNQLCTGEFYEKMKEMSCAPDYKSKPAKKVLWLDEYKNKNLLIKEELKDWQISFDTTCDIDEAVELYKDNSYDVVVVDVGSGSTIENVIAFSIAIKPFGQRAYFIFCGNWDIVNKRGKEMYDHLVPALTDSYTNVVQLLKDIVEDKQYL